jgi:integrase
VEKGCTIPRLVHSTPKYRLHRPSGQAVVTIQGKDRYLGPHGSKSSKAEYDRIIAEWLAKGRLEHQPPSSSELKITELIAAYWKFAERHYVKRGVPTAEQDCIRSALRHLRRLYGHTPATKLGPVALKAVRQAMIDAGMCRSTINKHVGRIRRMFRWAAAEELLPASLHHALATSAGLQRGRCSAREPEPIGPVSDSTIDETLPYLRPVVADMVRLQRLTGCRPEEVCMIRPCDVETEDDVWAYRPESEGPSACRSLCTWLAPQLRKLWM